MQSADSLITEDRFIDEIPDIVLYVRKKRGAELEDIALYELEKGQITRRTSARKGSFTFDRQNNTISFELNDARTEILQWSEIQLREPSSAAPVTNLLGTNPLGAIFSNTIPGRVFATSRIPEWIPAQAGTAHVGPIDLKKIAQHDGSPSVSNMTFAQLRGELRKRRDTGIIITPVLVQMHKQIAFSFAPFAFALVAIPLGIRAHRRETSIGMAISLILVMIYYSFMIIGEALQVREHLNPHLIVWIPNLLFQTLGIALLWRANRQG
jgi:lipopolysaccharide export system permease protein